MAIKGKGRAKSGRRAVARGPKPGYIEPPKPLFRRRWFRWTALAVLVAGVAAIVISSLLITGANNRKEAKAAARAKQLQRQQTRVGRFVTPALAALEDVIVPAGPTVVRDFPDLPQQFKDLRSSKLSDEDAKAKGEEVAANAKAAAVALSQIDATTIVSGFPKILGLLDAKQYMLSSLQLYEQIGNGLGSAADATGDQRSALITQDLALIPTASQLFQNGYQKMVNAQTDSRLTPRAPQPVPSPTPSAS